MNELKISVIGQMNNKILLILKIRMAIKNISDLIQEYSNERVCNLMRQVQVI